MAIMHTFKPYADCPDLCVAELPNGETCNECKSSHTLDDVLNAIAELRNIQRKAEEWVRDNEDICGVDDATWFDTIAHFDERLGDAGVVLADAVEQFIESTNNN